MKTTGEKSPELIPAILRQVKKVNRLRRVRIHTFGFTGGAGQWPPGSKYSGGRAPKEEPPEVLEAFLKRLAEENGGRFTPIR